MYQEYPENIKEQYKWLGRILNANNKKSDLEQEVSKWTHIT